MASKQGAAAETATLLPSPSTILDGFEDVAVNIASFVSAQDTLNLYCVNRGWHGLLSKHEELLFEEFLRRDFAEGSVLLYVARERELCRKKLYLAFLKKWSIPKDEEKVCFTWSRPSTEENHEEWDDYSGSIAPAAFTSEDVNSLVFIARVGKSESCALLQWNLSPRTTSNWNNSCDHLIIDENWSECTGGLVLPQNWQAKSLGGFENLVNSHRLSLTLHVLDCTFYQVATLVDENALEYYDFNAPAPENDFMLYYPTANLYGVPPEGSLDETDFSRFNECESRESEYPGVGYLPFSGVLTLKRGNDDDGNDILELYGPRLTIDLDSADYANIRRPDAICSFLRVLMKQKCLPATVVVEH